MPRAAEGRLLPSEHLRIDVEGRPSGTGRSTGIPVDEPAILQVSRVVLGAEEEPCVMQDVHHWGLQMPDLSDREHAAP
jgi:hypothetical protein